MRDQEFIRGQVPMTKSEVRAVTVSKLELEPDSILYDVGAGTGSVSVEASFYCPRGKVYAVEKKAEAVSLIQKNAAKFGAANVFAVEGAAPDVLRELEPPTHVFIGGTSGNMREILDCVREKNRDARIVINVIALESLSLVLTVLKEMGLEAEIVSLQVARARTVSGYHMMEGQNPVYILSTGGRRPYEEKDSQNCSDCPVQRQR